MRDPARKPAREPVQASDSASDVVIIGAGAAGPLLAGRLAAAGRRVVVLEAGPPWSLADLWSSQIWARRLKWGGPPVLHAGAAPFGNNMATGWGLGGSALHHYAAWPRMHAEDFRTHSLYGRGRDWPIDYDTLRPYYDLVQRECGLSGDAQREVWRPPGDPYPMPPLTVFKQGEILTRGFERLGLRVSPAPLAINSVVYKGRAACLNDGWCDAGCPILALANPFKVYIPAAQKAGARFIARATVTRIVLDTRGRARGVEYVNEHGQQQRLRAPLVILAAGTVQSARLLLASAQRAAPHGIGNDHGLIGQSFFCHNVVSAYGMFAEHTENHLGVTAGSLMSQDGYRKDGRKREDGFGSYLWGIGAALKPNDLVGIAQSRPDIWGPSLHGFMRTAVRHLAAMSAVCETFPAAEDRIELTAERDRFGVPLARVIRNTRPESQALAKYVAAEGIRIMKAAGAHESWNGMIATTHPLGGTVMGASPEDSVTDSFGRVHGVPGLVIAGGGLFPTAGGASPTFTLLALAQRTADHLTGSTSV